MLGFPERKEKVVFRGVVQVSDDEFGDSVDSTFEFSLLCLPQSIKEEKLLLVEGSECHVQEIFLYLEMESIPEEFRSKVIIGTEFDLGDQSYKVIKKQTFCDFSGDEIMKIFGRSVL